MDALRRKTSDERVGRAPLPELDKFAPRFARLFETRLRGTLGGLATCRAEDIGLVKFGSLTNPTDSSIVAVATLADGSLAGILVVDTTLMLRIIETALSAPPDEAPAAARPLTRVDEALAQPFAEDFFECFSAAVEAAWNAPPIGGLAFDRYARSVASLLEVEADSDMLELRLLTAFQEEAPEFPLRAAFSVAALDAMRGAAPPQAKTPTEVKPRDPRWSSAMKRAAADADLKLSAVLRRMHMSVGEIAELQVGDMVSLSLDGGMDVELTIQGSDNDVICVGQLGAANEQRAVMITEPPDDALVATVNEMLSDDA